MSQPNPFAERAEAIEELKRQHPKATEEEIEEALAEL